MTPFSVGVPVGDSVTAADGAVVAHEHAMGDAVSGHVGAKVGATEKTVGVSVGVSTGAADVGANDGRIEGGNVGLAVVGASVVGVADGDGVVRTQTVRLPGILSNPSRHSHVYALDPIGNALTQNVVETSHKFV